MNIDWHTVTRLNEFDWLFTFFFLFLTVVASFVAILRRDKAPNLDRGPYAARILSLILLGYGVTAFVTIDPLHILGSAYILVELDFLVADFGLFTLWKAGVIVSYYLQTRWTVRRIRDIGRFSKWWALLMVLPTISLFLVLVFALIPPRAARSPEPQSGDSGDEKPLPLLRAG